MLTIPCATLYNSIENVENLCVERTLTRICHVKKILLSKSKFPSYTLCKVTQVTSVIWLETGTYNDDHDNVENISIACISKHSFTLLSDLASLKPSYTYTKWSFMLCSQLSYNIIRVIHFYRKIQGCWYT